MSASKWDQWSKKDLSSELLNRMNYFYRQTDGSMNFPNSAEGDLLKMAYLILMHEESHNPFENKG